MMNGSLQALGWALIHFCWQAAAISAIYLIADLGLKNSRSHARYSLALATMSSMFLAFATTLGYEAWHSSTSLPLQFSRTPVAVVTNTPINVFATHFALLENGTVTLHLATLLPWLDGVWLLGVLSLTTRSVGGWLWLERLRRTTMDVAPQAVQASFQKVCVKLGIRRLPKLRISNLVSGPMTLGILRTLVLVPASALLTLTPEQLEAIFAHELAHVRRADYFWNLIQTLAETLFFFHPVVWWLGKRLREQRELCCDDIALETCSDPIVYATALFRLENQRAGLNLAMALDGHQSRMTFRSRVHRILGEADTQSQAAQLRPLSVLAVCTCFFLFLSPLPRTLGAVAVHSLPVKQMLEVPTKIVGATRHLSLQFVQDRVKRRNSAGESVTGATPSPLVSNSTAAQIARSVSDNLDYEKQMRASGYDVEKGQYAAMQKAGITPSYAEEMSGMGFGRPSVGNLLELKEQNITGQYLTTLQAAGLKPRGFDDLITVRLFGITPEYVDGMKAAGYDSIPLGKLRDLRAVGVTPEYAKAIKQQFPNATVQDLIKSRAKETENNIASSLDSQGARPPAFLGSTASLPPPHIRRRSTPKQAGQSDSPPPLIQ